MISKCRAVVRSEFKEGRSFKRFYDCSLGFGVSGFRDVCDFEV